MADAEQLDRLAALLRAADQIVVLTGAGISTESGIPDYRSPGGIWSQYRPIDFDAFLTSEEARREYWRRWIIRISRSYGIRPTPTCRARIRSRMDTGCCR